MILGLNLLLSTVCKKLPSSGWSCKKGFCAGQALVFGAPRWDENCHVRGGVVNTVKHGVYNCTPNLGVFEFAMIMLAIRRSDVVQFDAAGLLKATLAIWLAGWWGGWDPAGSELLGMLFAC